MTPQGAIAGRAPGTVRITAALDDARASIVIPVLPPRVAAVDIADPPTSVIAGRSFALTATALDGANAPLTGRAIQWSSSDVRVAVVTGDGHVAALTPGSAVLTASSEGVRASVRIGVAADVPAPALEPNLRPPPRRRSRRPRRRALVLGGGVIAAGVLWTLLQPDFRDGDPRSARATSGPAAGYAGPGAGVDTAVVSAVAAPIVAIAPRPTRALRPDATARLTAEVRDAAGRLLEGAPVVWSSSDSTVAGIDAAGRLVARRPGRAQIVAASGAGRDSVVITVRKPGASVPVVASIAIDRAALLPVPAGDSTRVRAVALGPQGDTLSGAEITWASSNPQIASVDALTGVARAHAPGTALIVASSGNQTSLVELTVLPNAVVALQVLGARPMAVQESLSLRAAGRDVEGQEVSGIPAVWTSSDSTIAAVEESTGVVVGRARGSVRITATADGISAWIRLTVLPRPEPLAFQGSAEAGDGGGADWAASGLEECYDAVRSRNVSRLRAVWQSRSRADEANLKRLTRILGTSAWNASVGDRIARPPVIGPELATMNFIVPLTWREPPGGTRSSQLVFQAEFVRAAGRWEMSTCRIVGAPRF